MFSYIKVAVVAVLLATPASAQNTFWDNYNRAYNGGPVTQPQPQQQPQWNEPRNETIQKWATSPSGNQYQSTITRQGNRTVEQGVRDGQYFSQTCRQQGSLIFCD